MRHGDVPVSTAGEFVAEPPEIKINTEYFRAAGIPVEDEAAANTQSEADMEALSADLDAEYFSWKDGGEKPEPKKSIFPSFLKKK